MPTIYHDFIINISREKIFEAIASSDGINNWWTLQCHGNFELNEIINFNFTDDYNWFAKISEFEKNKKIEFVMIESMEEWLPTSFGFNLISLNEDETQVSFYHKDWKTITAEYKNASYCWAMLLSQLKNYLENGIITPFEKRN